MEPQLIYVALAALAGAMASAFMGWLDSKEPFDPRKFGSSERGAWWPLRV